MPMNIADANAYHVKQAEAMASQMPDYGLGKQAYINQAVPAPASPINDVYHTFEEARVLAGRVKELVGRLIGFQPEDPKKAGLDSGALFESIRCNAVDTRQAIGEAMVALSRLENLLP